MTAPWCFDPCHEKLIPQPFRVSLIYTNNSLYIRSSGMMKNTLVRLTVFTVFFLSMFARALWIPGHWMHDHGEWVWKSGHWKKRPWGWKWIPATGRNGKKPFNVIC
jgi:hypothetical protein